MDSSPSSAKSFEFKFAPADPIEVSSAWTSLWDLLLGDAAGDLSNAVRHPGGVTSTAYKERCILRKQRPAARPAGGSDVRGDILPSLDEGSSR